jgi:hypothetical protein
MPERRRPSTVVTIPRRDPGAVADRLLRLLEADQGVVDVCVRAARAARHEDLRGEWNALAASAIANASIVSHVLVQDGTDPRQLSFGRELVRNVTRTLAQNVEAALTFAGAAEAELVAADAVLQVETNARLQWSLLATIADRASGELRWALSDALLRGGAPERDRLALTRAWLHELTASQLHLRASVPPTIAVPAPAPAPAEDDRSLRPVRVHFSRT